MTLAVTVSGAGQALVMLHGWGMNSAVWGSVIETLSQQFKVYAIDLPGHGSSSTAAVTNSLDDWVEAVLAVAPEQAIWVGWSLGGMIAQQAAFDSPHRVTALMLVTSTPVFMRGDDWHAGMARETLAQFSAALMQDSKRTLLRFLSLQVKGSADERAVLKQLRTAIETTPAPTQRALTAGLELLDQVDLRQQLSALQLPTCWLFGEKDTLVAAETAVAVKQLLPKAKTIKIPGAGHAPFLSHPAVSIAALELLAEEIAQKRAVP